MKIITILTLSILISFPLFTYAQIPNPGFEAWEMKTGYENPVGWDNLNQLTASKNVLTCDKGKPGSAGNFYIRLVSDSVEGMGVVPGITVSGKLDPITMKPKSGFAYDKRPSALTGKWQFMAQGNDPGFIAVYFTKWNSSTKKREIIGGGIDSLDGMEMAWASFSIPITFSNASTPDSCMILLSASSATPLQFSYLFVDELAFETSSGIFDNNFSSKTFRCFPNPVNDLLRLDLRDIKHIQQIKISNLQGQVVFSETTDVNPDFINIGQLPSGFYLISIQSEDSIAIQKFDKL